MCFGSDRLKKGMRSDNVRIRRMILMKYRGIDQNMLLINGKTAALATVTIFLVTACSESAPQPVEVNVTDAAPSPVVETPDPVLDPGVVIQPAQTLDLDQYSEFSFQEASTVGLSSSRAIVADALLTEMTSPWVMEAKAENETQECLSGESKCGYFSLTLEWLKCESNLLCVLQRVEKTGIGMATGFSSVDAIRINPVSGKDETLEMHLGENESNEFLLVLNETATEIQRTYGFYDPDNPPNYMSSSVPAWLPLADGIHVWFPKYDVAPGALGIVEARFQPSTKGWDSWVLTATAEVPVVATSSQQDKVEVEPGVTVADDFTLANILTDIEWNLDPIWCRQVSLSNRDADWGIFEASPDAYDNPELCTLSDSFSYIGKINGTWRFLNYPGSDVDYCSAITRGLSNEGAPRIAIKDFFEARDCQPDEGE